MVRQANRCTRNNTLTAITVNRHRHMSFHQAWNVQTAETCNQYYDEALHWAIPSATYLGSRLHEKHAHMNVACSVYLCTNIHISILHIRDRERPNLPEGHIAQRERLGLIWSPTYIKYIYIYHICIHACMYICIYIYMYVYIYIYIDTYLYIYNCIDVHIDIHIYLYMYIYTYVQV